MYLALYRKYRPQTFDDVVSQSHITTTLKNQIKSNQVGHAYMFTGSRGTGKTSCAKILAKAINCISPVNGNPCLKCESCVEIENGATDIMEIDAASNNGVDDVRLLRDEVNYTPVSCTYRVYIIDEVHMMTPSAFNALLKTLEEPPPHVVFILATTEIHKVPATVLSRCQRFEFRRINPMENAKLLLNIAAFEDISLDIPAAELIAKLSDGGLRDAISLLDQCAAQNNKITVPVVMECSGTSGKEYLFGLTDAVINKDPVIALNMVNDLYRQSKDLARLSFDMSLHFRNLMILKATGDKNLLSVMADEAQSYITQSEKISTSEIMRCLSALQECGEEISKAPSKRTVLEMCLIKLCTPKLDTNLNALIARIEKLENKLSTISTGVVTVDTIPGEISERIVVRPDELSPHEKIQKHEKTEDISNIEEAYLYEEIPLPEPTPLFESLPQEPIVSTVDMNEGENYSERKSQPSKLQEEKPKVPVLNDFNADNEVAQWAEILENAPTFLSGILDNTKAYLHNDSIHIVTNNKVVKPILEHSGNMNRIKVSVEAVLGKQYNVLVVNSNEESEINTPPIEKFIKNAIELGINIKVLYK